MITSNILRRFPDAHRLPKPLKAALVAKIRLSLDNPLAVERAVTILFKRQTSVEQAIGATKEDNNLGVMSCHGRQIAYYGKWLASGRSLSGYHLVKARKLANKYAATQLFELAAVKGGYLDAMLEREAIQGV